jgi:O-antigen ligase
MLAFVVQMGVLAVVVVWAQQSRKTTLALATFLVIGVGLVLWLGGSEVAKRLATIHADTKTELSGGTRLDIDRDALRIFADRPILGWGLGTFPDVYPQFCSFNTNFFINETHNDYLQLLVEMGSLGTRHARLLWAVYQGIRS